jgi:signal peptidase II
MRSRMAWIRAALVLVAVILADQLTKRWIADSITPGQTRHVLPGLQFVHTFNDGVAFGLAPGGHTIVIALIGLALLLSNILDRVRDGSVTDFIKLPLGWPPFNLADAAITVGVVILALVVETGARGDAARNAPDAEDAPRRGRWPPRLRSSE